MRDFRYAIGARPKITCQRRTARDWLLDSPSWQPEAPEPSHQRRTRTSQTAIGDNNLINVRLTHFAGSSRTSPEVREVPQPDFLHGNKIVFFYSITSVAMASTLSGICSPRALAVSRLSTNSYFVGACTGKSAGFSPLRMRSM